MRLTAGLAVSSKHPLPLVLIALCVLIGVVNPVFLSLPNLFNILLQSTVISIVAAGMTFVIILGGIDLGVGSIVALCGILTGMLLHAGVPALLAVPPVLAAGAACGAVSGALTGYGKVAPFVATLGMFGAARGFALSLSDGRSISGFDSRLLVLTSGTFLGLPLPIVILLVVFAVSAAFLRATYWGIRIYAIGGNPRAARLSGVNLGRYNIAVYAFSGLMSALAAILLVSRLDAALPTAGMGYELDAIAAVVIGGATLSGGRGSVWGSLFGSLILAVLKNGLTILNVSSYFQQIVTGVVIVVAVLFDYDRRKGASNET
jgi:ribose transport system permease protein